MHIPDYIIDAITATVPRPVTVTNSKGTEVPLVHHDVGSQLGDYASPDWYGYDEPIRLDKILAP